MLTSFTGSDIIKSPKVSNIVIKIMQRGCSLLVIEKMMFEHIDLLRGETETVNYKLILLPVYSLKFLEEKNLIPDEMSIKEILNHESNIADQLQRSFQYVEDNFHALKGVYTIFPENVVSNRTLFQLLLKINAMTLSVKEWAELAEELLYHSYEWEGVRGGENYSPKSINQLGIELLNPISGTFYDGTAGFGGTLVSALEYSKQNNGELKLYGQEIDHTSWALAKLNLLLHDKLDAELIQGDALLNPAFIDGDRLKKFNFIMMDFPWVELRNHYETLKQDKYNRFIYGIPPRRSADFAFIMHTLASLESDGKAVLVVPGRTLFASGMEQSIRQNLIAADVIEAVIALPAGLYKHTGIQTNLLILNKNKSLDRKGRILFINAENEFQTKQRYLKVLTKDNIDKIISTYRNGLEIEQFSKFVSSNEIEEANLFYKKYLTEKVIDTDFFGKVQFVKESKEYSLNIYPLKKLTEKIFRGMNVSSNSIEEGTGEFKLVKLSDVQDGEILLDDLSSIRFKRNSRIDMYLLRKGDVIVSNRGTTIKVAVVPENEGNLILSHNFLGIRCKDDIDPYYLKAYLESPVGMYYLINSQVGTNILTINPKDLKEIPVKLTSLDEQRKIANEIREAVITYKEKIRQAEQERNASLLKAYEKMGISSLFKIIEQ